MNKNELRNAIYFVFAFFFFRAKGSRYNEGEEPHTAPEPQVADGLTGHGQPCASS